MAIFKPATRQATLDSFQIQIQKLSDTHGKQNCSLFLIGEKKIAINSSPLLFWLNSPEIKTWKSPLDFLRPGVFPSIYTCEL